VTHEQTETVAHAAQLDRLSAKLERLSAQVVESYLAWLEEYNVKL
jgi:hypothetical protein